MHIIYEDDCKLIVFKPAGKLTQGNRSFDVDLVSEVMTYRRRKKEDVYAAVINRLDRPVSGLVLFAKDKKEAARLSRLLQKDTFEKEYLAIVCGKPNENKGTFVDYLQKDPKMNLSKVVSSSIEGARKAILNYRVLDTLTDQNGNSYSLVKIELVTGRHHQIRVQFSSRHLPLLGDVKYQGKDATGVTLLNFNGNPLKYRMKRNEIALCSISLTIDQEKYTCNPDWYEYQKNDQI